MSDPKKDFQHIRLEFEVGLVEKPLGGINKLHWQVAGFFDHLPLSKSIKMNSLCQISSKMLHSTQVFILVEKKRKEVAWLGFELASSQLEVQCANHYNMETFMMN